MQPQPSPVGSACKSGSRFDSNNDAIMASGNWRARKYWHAGQALEVRLGTLLVEGKHAEFLENFQALLNCPRLTAVFFASTHGLMVLLLLVHAWKQLGYAQVESLLTAVEDVSATSPEAIRYYRMRLAELSGLAVDAGTRERYRTEFLSAQEARFAAMQPLAAPESESLRDAVRSLFGTTDG